MPDWVFVPAHSTTPHLRRPRAQRPQAGNRIFSDNANAGLFLDTIRICSRPTKARIGGREGLGAMAAQSLYATCLSDDHDYGYQNHKGPLPRFSPPPETVCARLAAEKAGAVSRPIFQRLTPIVFLDQLILCSSRTPLFLSHPTLRFKLNLRKSPPPPITDRLRTLPATQPQGIFPAGGMIKIVWRPSSAI